MLLSSKAQECKDLWKPSKPCCVGIYSIALAEYSQMSTHVPGFQSLFRFFAYFVLDKLTSSSIRVKKVDVFKAVYCQGFSHFSDFLHTVILRV